MVERIAFFEESLRDQYVRLIACGEMDATLLDALQAFIGRQRCRLAIAVRNGDLEMASWHDFPSCAPGGRGSG